jgi:hypothetical protein
MWVNALKVPIMPSSDRKYVVGDRRGTVMWKKEESLPAPSTSAAS